MPVLVPELSDSELRSQRAGWPAIGGPFYPSSLGGWRAELQTRSARTRAGVALVDGLHQIHQRQRRLPAPDGHRLVVRRRRDAIEAALGPLGAQPLRIDEAVAGPDSVDAFLRRERGHRGGSVDTHQEDRITVVRAGLVAEPLRTVVDGGLQVG